MEQEIKLNLGCGYTGHQDWINIDYGILAFINKFPFLKKIVFTLKMAPEVYNQTWPKNLRIIDLRKGLPYKENTVSYIFTAHFLEHLEKFQAAKLLKSCYACLKPGGTMRILVPDLDIVVRQYQENSDNLEKVEKINSHFWGFKKSDDAPTVHQKVLSFFIRGHQWLYNFEYLRQTLIEAGFDPAKVVRCQYQKGKVPNLDFLDNHPDHALMIEATK